MKKLMVFIMALFMPTMVFAFGGATDPSTVTTTAERMAGNVLRVLIVSIPILYFLGIVMASVIFAFKSYNRAKNDQVESPGKVAATTALIIALVGFGGGGILFLAADKWIFNGQFFGQLAILMTRVLSGQ